MSEVREGRSLAQTSEEESRARCPSKRRGRRSSFRGSAAPPAETPRSLISSADDEAEDDEDDDALLFTRPRPAAPSRTQSYRVNHSDRIAPTKSSSSGRRSGDKSPVRRRGVGRAHSTDDLHLMRKHADSSHTMYSPKGRESRRRSVRHPRANDSPVASSPAAGKAIVSPTSKASPGRAHPTLSPMGNKSGSKGMKRFSNSNRKSRPNPNSTGSDNEEEDEDIDSDDDDDDQDPISYLGGLHQQQHPPNIPADSFDESFSSAYYSSATEGSANEDNGGSERKHRSKRGAGGRRHRRASTAGVGARSRASARASRTVDAMLDSSEVDSTEDNHPHDMKKKRRPKDHNRRALSNRDLVSGHGDALQFTPGVTANVTVLMDDATDREEEMTEHGAAADDEGSVMPMGETRRERPRSLRSNDIQALLADTKLDGSFRGSSTKMQDGIAQTVQQAEKHDAAEAKKKKKGFGKMLGMLRNRKNAGEPTESDYESSASTASSRGRGVHRSKSRLVESALHHALLSNDDSDEDRDMLRPSLQV